MGIAIGQKGEKMDDLISRQAALDVMAECCDHIRSYTDAWEGIKKLPSADVPDRNAGWIPCSERLPYAEFGESNNVFATCRKRYQESPDEYRWVEILYFNGGVWCYPTGETYGDKVVAWMQLPEP